MAVSRLSTFLYVQNLVAMATDRLKYSQNNNIYDDSKY
jgi:hypothetical protein